MFWRDKGTRDGTSYLVRGQSWGRHPIEVKWLRDTSGRQNLDAEGQLRDTEDSGGTRRGREGRGDPRRTLGGTTGPP